jgi:hypothetical protein
MRRQVQGSSAFVPGDPFAGYYNDLTPEARLYTDAKEALDWFDVLTMRRERIAPLDVVQLGIAAWQLRDEDPGWIEVCRRASEWVVLDADGHGRLAYGFAMPHTYELDAPWYSAMAQGQAASLLVRAADLFNRPELITEARRMVRCLLELDTPLVALTDEGAVLQEYPTDPPAHVLNGWIFALWGLYDLHCALPDDVDVAGAWNDGVATLVERLPMYDSGGWSRYDLYPHPIVHVASPFYHRLHVAQLQAMDALHPNPVFRTTAERWQRSSSSRARTAVAVARKVGFRMLRPRRTAEEAA